jgi:2-desacetyl-2-hydroxyethyl bacteriochlorophyllide A dehydrogenase
MKAAVLKGPRKLVVEEVADPRPGPDQVLVRMRYCGICGSDMHLYRDPRTPPGSIMGHEFVGEVAEVGAGVTRFQVGDRVWFGGGPVPTWSWRPEYGWDLDALLRDDFMRQMGGFGQYAVHHQLTLAPVPPEVGDIGVCMADQAATALAGVYAARLRMGETVLVTGAGAVGLWALRCAQIAGARRICVAEPREGRAAHARRLCADRVVDPEQPAVREQLVEFYDGVGPDVALECSGAGSGVQFAMDCVRPGGRIAIVGLSHHPVGINTLQMCVKGVSLTPVASPDRPGGMELVRQGRADYTRFPYSIVPLEQAPAAFERLVGPTDEVKLIIQHPGA